MCHCKYSGTTLHFMYLSLYRKVDSQAVKGLSESIVEK